MIRTFEHPRETLLVALAASMLVHASAGAMLRTSFAASPAIASPPQPPLTIRIANAPADAPTQRTESASVLAADRQDAVTARIRRTDATPDESVRTLTTRVPDTITPASAPGTAAAPTAQRFSGHVDVAPDPTLERVGWFLEARSHTEFPTEVQRPVLLAEPLRVEYPAAALAAHREGRVVAWIAVDADGVAQEVNFVAGDDDFAEVLADPISAARFTPATNTDSQAIPFYTVLVFDFHIDRASTDGASAAVASPSAKAK